MNVTPSAPLAVTQRPDLGTPVVAPVLLSCRSLLTGVAYAREGEECFVKIHEVSHLDHGLSEAAIEWLLSQFGERDCFFIETVELPPTLGRLACGLHGPLMGDDPVREDEVVYRKRGDRPGKSRMVARSARPTRLVSVIAGPHDGEPCILYTAFGGPVAPREPFDPGLDETAKAASEAFWAEHALSA